MSRGKTRTWRPTTKLPFRLRPSIEPRARPMWHCLKNFIAGANYVNKSLFIYISSTHSYTAVTMTCFHAPSSPPCFPLTYFVCFFEDLAKNAPDNEKNGVAVSDMQAHLDEKRMQEWSIFVLFGKGYGQNTNQWFVYIFVYIIDHVGQSKYLKTLVDYFVSLFSHPLINPPTSQPWKSVL